MLTHCTLTSSGSPTHPRYDARGRTGPGILRGDEGHTPALLPLWVDGSIPGAYSRLHSRTTQQSSKYYGSIRKRRRRHRSPTWLTTVGSWRSSRGGAVAAAWLCFYLCNARQCNYLEWSRVCNYPFADFLPHASSQSQFEEV